MSSSLSTLVVYTVGLSSTEVAVFAAVSRILRLQNIQIQIAEKPDSHCQLIIIHSDSERGKIVFDKLKDQEIRQHILLIADKKPDLSSVKMRSSFLQKPLRVQELLEMLEKINKQVERANQTSNPSANKPSPVVSPKVETTSTNSGGTYSSNSLLATLLQARSQGSIYQVANKYHNNFWVNGTTQEVFSNYSAEELFKLIGEHHSSGYVISSLSLENFGVLTEKKVKVKLNDILWYAALADKRGELVSDLTEDTPVKLTSWPNMTRLSFDSSHIRIAAVLSRQAETLNSLIAKNQLLRIDTICFLNAAYSIHLLERQAQAEVSVVAKPTDQKKSSLLHKIANHLHIKL